MASTIGSMWRSDFGGYARFAEQFRAAAVGQFGSGWAWLVLDGNTLKVTRTANADTPLVYGQTPLLTIDVWQDFAGASGTAQKKRRFAG
jgi:superoxide dismutase, Fe-Mn family